MLNEELFRNAADLPESCFSVRDYEDGVIVESCSSEEMVLKIPETINGKPVRAFCMFAHYGYGYKVLIPPTVHTVLANPNAPLDWMDRVCIAQGNPNFSVENGLLLSADKTIAFTRCDNAVTEIVIPDATEIIAESAFSSGVDIETIHLGKNVKEIGTNAFPNTLAGWFRRHGSTDESSRPLALRAITVSEENETYSSKDGFLYSKDGKTLLKAPEIIPDGVYRVPEGTECLAQGSFSRNQGIQKLIAEYPLTKIDGKAFEDCFRLNTVQIREIETIDVSAFVECFSLKNVTVERAGTIAGFAFNRCRSLRNVHLGHVDTLGTAFWDSGLKSVLVPKSVRSLQPRTFMWCSDINIEIYDSVSANPGELAYTYDFSLKGWSCARHWVTVRRAEDETVLYRVYMGNRSGTHNKYKEAVVKGWGKYPEFDFETLDGAFSSLKELEERTEVAKLRLMYPVSLTDGAKKQYEDFLRRNAKKIVAKCLENNDVETVQVLVERNLLKQDVISSAIESCSGESQSEMMAILLSARGDSPADSQESFKITSAAELLKKLWSTKKLPDGTLEITAYKGDEEHVVVPALIGKGVVTRIGENALSAASAKKDKKEKLEKIKSVTVSEGINDIGESAFSGCSSLEKIHIPETVETIGKSAFRGCEKLKDASGMVIVRNVLYGYFGDEKEVTVPETVTEISAEAFADRKNLTKVIIPASVAKIAERAFYRCDAIRNLVISGNAVNIHPNAMEACRKMTIHAPAGSTAEAFATGNPKRFGFKAEGEAAVSADTNEAAQPNKQTAERTVKRIKILEDTWQIFRGKTPAQIKKEWGVEAAPEGLTIVKYKGEGNMLVIPGSIGGKAVVRLAEDSFRASCGPERDKKSAYNKKMYLMKAVIVEEGIVQIGKSAFAGCVFMTDICLPATVTEIAEDAFRDCHKLKIHAPALSYAESYAKEHNIPFEAE